MNGMPTIPCCDDNYLYRFVKHRLVSFQHEIDNLLQSEFAYPHTEYALKVIQQNIEENISILDEIEDFNTEVIKQECQIGLRSLVNYLPILGFLLRSTNVRNAFETYRPLLRLAREVMKIDIKLVIASEWYYSPIIYFDSNLLNDFVLIGLPAPESSNPLLIPLAGHELGHAYWRNYKIDSLFTNEIMEKVSEYITNDWDNFCSTFLITQAKKEEIKNDIFVNEILTEPINWIMKQVEETFADFVAVKIFGLSFLHAFAYLIAPGYGPSSPNYPPMTERAKAISRAFKEFYPHLVDEKFVDKFHTLFSFMPNNPLNKKSEFLINIANNVRFELIDDVINKVNELISEGKLSEASDEESKRIFKCLSQITPVERCNNIIDILNAGWAIYHKSDIWRDRETIYNKRDEVLRELLLKSFEVYEIEQILKQDGKYD